MILKHLPSPSSNETFWWGRNSVSALHWVSQLMFSLSAWLQTTRRCKSSFHTQEQHVFSHPLDFQALSPVWLYCHVLLCLSQQDWNAEENSRKALYSLCKGLFSFPTKSSGALLRNRTCPSWACTAWEQVTIICEFGEGLLSLS